MKRHQFILSIFIVALLAEASCKSIKQVRLSEKPVQDTTLFVESPDPVHIENPTPNFIIESQPQNLFKNAFDTISAMLSGDIPYSFERAVFLTENAFVDDFINYSAFSSEIEKLSQLAWKFAEANRDNFLYHHSDKEEVLKYAAIFNVMMDTVNLNFSNDLTFFHLPFTYDFEDIWGKKDWKKMFVANLLYTKKGNCHSLPYLYKIIADRLGVKAYLAMAPNHIYIKHYSQKIGMYNTELTSAAFPIDAWLMASGYVHTDAIRSGIYMDTLSEKQSLALCLLDLAKGYERKYGTVNDAFMSKCLDKALAYYPNFINALLLKSEILKRRYETAKASSDPIAKAIFQQYENLIIKIYQLGYRKMPEIMYLDWLLLLKENREKYSNKEIITNLNTVKTN